ncbi:hypothetical protein MBLNU459_g3903t1 [Dothideomycetes sp. NU459]
MVAFFEIALVLLVPIAFALPTPAPAEKRSTFVINKVIDQDFADPSLLQVGSVWYAFATNNHKTLGNASAIGSGSPINVQTAYSADFDSWRVLGLDALPVVGAWVDPNAAAVWAPKVIMNDLGQYVLHYSARRLNGNGKHCIGAAVSITAVGPYVPETDPLACPLDQGGAIDSSAFRDVDGTFYVVYKVDGNSIGHGGSCGNMVEPIVPTPILIQQLAADALTPVGSPVQILDRNSNDGPLVEAPSLTRSSDGSYVLFFSSNCYASKWYDVTYAFADNVLGPYVKAGPMAVTGRPDAALYSPGGADVDADAQHAVFHAGDVGPHNMGWRSMYTMQIVVDSASKVVSTTS